MITITRDIIDLIGPYTHDEKIAILSNAWNACCDGAYLARYELTSNPWEEGHKLTQGLIEYAAIIDAINAINGEV